MKERAYTERVEKRKRRIFRRGAEQRRTRKERKKGRGGFLGEVQSKGGHGKGGKWEGADF
jgi:hypothetical protein